MDVKRLYILIGLGLFVGWMWRSNIQASTLPPTTSSTAVPSTSAPTTPVPVEFPCVLGNAGLIVTDIVSFEGITPESEEEEFVIDALALLIYNPGKTSFTTATITLSRGEETLYFDLEYLPAGSRVLVVERNHSPYGSGEFDSCECISFLPEAFPLSQSQLQITYQNGSLAVENVSDIPFSSVTIYYKAYSPQDNLYVGGKAMSVFFGSLQPGESKCLSAYGYAEPYSRITAVIIHP